MEPARAERLLAHPARKKVYDLICEQPGISMSSVARGAQIYWTAAALHVEQLRAAGLVHAVRIGRRRVLYPAPLAQLHDDPRLSMLTEPACATVALAIVRHPDARVWEICEITRMSERAVYYHVKRLVDEGLVSRTHARAHRGLVAGDALEAWAAAQAAASAELAGATEPEGQ